MSNKTAVATPEDDSERLEIRIVIVCEDELVHTAAQPFCDDLTCPCQLQAQYVPYEGVRYGR